MNTTSMYGKMLEVHVVAPELVDGRNMFPWRRPHHCKINYKFANAKWRWDNTARIYNLEMGYLSFYKALARDEAEINENLKKHGIDYAFHGFQEHADKVQAEKMAAVNTLKEGRNEVIAMKDEDKAMSNVFL